MQEVDAVDDALRQRIELRADVRDIRIEAGQDRVDLTVRVREWVRGADEANGIRRAASSFDWSRAQSIDDRDAANEERQRSVRLRDHACARQLRELIGDAIASVAKIRRLRTVHLGRGDLPVELSELASEAIQLIDRRLQTRTRRRLELIEPRGKAVERTGDFNTALTHDSLRARRAGIVREI